MASQIGHINVAGNVPGKADVIGPRKGMAGGRKPLGDLTNARKPINQADGKKALGGSINSSKPSGSLKQIKPKNLTVVLNNEAVPAKAKKLESNVARAIKTSGKSHNSSRKALSDISNSGKPHALEMKNKNILKPSRVRDLNLDEIGEEMCFHDHQKCVKSQLEYESVDVDQFFKTLENDLNDGFTIYSPPKKMKFEIGNESRELEELPEELPAMRSPVCPGTPESSSSSSLDYLSSFSILDLGLKLIDSP